MYKQDIVFQMTWFHVHDREKSRKHQAEPAHSPSMVGGQFSISKEFWERIGMYDPELQIWGAENFEISLKVTRFN